MRYWLSQNNVLHLSGYCKGYKKQRFIEALAIRLLNNSAPISFCKNCKCEEHLRRAAGE